MGFAHKFCKKGKFGFVTYSLIKSRACASQVAATVEESQGVELDGQSLEVFCFGKCKDWIQYLLGYLLTFLKLQ